MSIFEDIFGVQTIGVKDPTYISDHGSQQTIYPDSPTRTIPGCDMQTGATAEDTIQRDGQMVEYTLYAPVTADLPDDALVVYDGRDFEIIGAVRVFTDPFGTDYRTALLHEWVG